MPATPPEGLFGGRADKFGNDFERDWVVSLALRVLRGEMQSVHWEPLRGGSGIDVRAMDAAGTRKTVYQCKMKCGTNTNWTIARLAEEGVLDAIKEQLVVEGVADFAFVSLVFAVREVIDVTGTSRQPRNSIST